MRPAVREVALRRRAVGDRLGRGHPWVWQEAISRGLEGALAGEEVQVVGPGGSPVGRGLADPASPIAVRLWTRGRQAVDETLWRLRASIACGLREWLFDGTRTNAYRIVHGEGDRMPGLV